MLKPERVTFHADDDNFHQFSTRDQESTFLNNSLVHYSTDFKRMDEQQITPIKHSTSLEELSAMTTQQQPEVEPPASAPPTLVSQEEILEPIIPSSTLDKLDALTLQKMAIGSSSNLSNIDEYDTQSQMPPILPSISLVDVQKELDRVRQMKSDRSSHPSSSTSLCSRLTINPFVGSSNSGVDLSSLTHSLHFKDRDYSTAGGVGGDDDSSNSLHLPFSSTYITSIPESTVLSTIPSSSSSIENHFIPIRSSLPPRIDSPTLEDHEVFETFHSKPTKIHAPGVAIRTSTTTTTMNSLNRNFSASESDLLASLNRPKQFSDAQSDHETTYSGTSDEMLFIEWDKERHLFQDYINSLRIEIQVLLQERLDYQTNMQLLQENFSERKRTHVSITDEETSKLNLLQKSLAEKNTVLEQLQTEYEVFKEKNATLTRKISTLRCDAKAQAGVIDELKQKIAELTVDLQNHLVIKRRLQLTMTNLEQECQIIDADRRRLTIDLDQNRLQKQDIEKSFQQANVKIAEQGSIIEMLRSDNVQIRSQLSSTQRRMLQEKQQIMDYLRQIEGDLVEKEQLKQRESLLRKNVDQLQMIQNQDRETIEKFTIDKEQFEQEREQLLKTIHTMDDDKARLETKLETLKSALVFHLNMPTDSIRSVDQLIPMLENRYRIEQARVHTVSNPEQEIEELRSQCKQLNEANQAWQQYQQNQLMMLRDRFFLAEENSSSLDDIMQQIESRLSDLKSERDGLVDQVNELRTVSTDTVDRMQQEMDELRAINAQLKLKQLETSRFEDIQTRITPEDVSSTIDSDHQRLKKQFFDMDERQEIQLTRAAPEVDSEKEIRQLQVNLATLTAQLDETNRAWQHLQQTQLDMFKNKFQDWLPFDPNISLDQVAQAIVDHLTTERQTFNQQFLTLSDQCEELDMANKQLMADKQFLNSQLDNRLSVIGQERDTQTIDSDTRVVKKQTRDSPFEKAQIHDVGLLQSAPAISNEQEEQIRQLRTDLALVTAQCAQLDEANRAWQHFQQTQLDTFRTKLQDWLPFEENTSLDQVAQAIVDHLIREREAFNQQLLLVKDQCEELDMVNKQLMGDKQFLNSQLDNRSALIGQERETQTIGSLDDPHPANLLDSSPSETRVVKKQSRVTPFEEARIHNVDVVQSAPAACSDHEEQIRQLHIDLAAVTAQCAQLDEANRAWQQFHQTQLDDFRTKLQNCFPIDYSSSFGEIAQQIVSHLEQLGKERDQLEQTDADLRSESAVNLETIQQSYVNTVNELNQQLLAIKAQCEEFDMINKQLEAEKELLKSQIENQTNGLESDWNRISSETKESEEIDELRTNLAALTVQCSQLDEANRAWQQFHQTQLDDFLTKLQHSLPIDQSSSFDQMAQQIIVYLDQLVQERDESTQQREIFEKLNADLRSESKMNIATIETSYVNTINELNQDLLKLKEQCEELKTINKQLDAEREHLKSQSIVVREERDSQTIESDSNVESIDISSEKEQRKEIDELRTNLAALTDRLDEANRFQQIQLEKFKTIVQKHLPMDDQSLSFDQIAQQIVAYLDQLAKERETFTAQWKASEKLNSDLRSESSINIEKMKQTHLNEINVLNQQLTTLREQFDELEQVNKQLENRSITSEIPAIEPIEELRTIAPLQSAPIHDIERESEELRELRADLAAITSRCAQLDEANRAWQQFQQNQLDMLRRTFESRLPLIINNNNSSLDQFAQQIISHLDELTNERDTLQVTHQEQLVSSTNIESKLIQDLEHLNQQLIHVYNQCEQLREHNTQLQKRDEQQQRETQTEDDQLEAEFLALQHQYQELDRLNTQLLADKHLLDTQLNTINHDWQQFQENQLDRFRKQFDLDSNVNLEQIAQVISTRFDAFRSESIARIDSLENELRQNDKYEQQCDELRQINSNLLIEKQNLISRLNEIEHRSSPALSDPSKQLTSGFVKKRTRRVPTDETQIHTVASSVLGNEQQETEEIQQLRAQFVVLTNRCAQLDEANRAWQQFQQTQLDIFRSKLQDWLPFEIDTTSIEHVAQQLVTHLDQLAQERGSLTRPIATQDGDSIDSMQQQLTHYQYNESFLAHNLEQLNQKLLGVYSQCEELREHNAQLMITKQQIDVRLEEREAQIEDIEQQTRDKEQSFMEQIAKLNQQLSELQEKNDPIVENQVDTNATIEHEREEEIRQLRSDLSVAAAQCIELGEANRAWQQYQQDQIESLRHKFQERMLLLDHHESSSLDHLAHQIIIHLDGLINEREGLIRQIEGLKEELSISTKTDRIEPDDSGVRLVGKRSRAKLTPEAQIHTVPEHETEDIRQLRADVTTLTAQCAQLDEANRAWQHFQQTQLDTFRTKLQDWLPFEENTSLDQVAQAIVDHLIREREAFNQQLLLVKDQCEELDMVNKQLMGDKQFLNSQLDNRSVPIGQERETQTIGSLDDPHPANLLDSSPSETRVVKKQTRVTPFEEARIHNVDVVQSAPAACSDHEEQIRQLHTDLAALTAQCAQLDEANRAWQQFHQTQLDDFRTKLQNCFPIDYSSSFGEIAQQIVSHLEQLGKERDQLEQTDADLRSESAVNLETIQQSYVNAVNELNQELLAIKAQCEEFDMINKQLEAEKELLKSQIENQTNGLESDWNRISSETKESEEIDELRANLAALTVQCSQLDEANRAWQQFHQTQLDDFRTKLQNSLPIDENSSFDQIAQQIVVYLDQFVQERDESTKPSEKSEVDLLLESPVPIETLEQSHVKEINELNQQLTTLREQCEELDAMNKQLVAEKEFLINQGEDRSIVVGHHRDSPTVGVSSSDLNLVETQSHHEPESEIRLHTIASLQSAAKRSEEDNAEKIHQLRTDLATVTAQLDDAYRVWQNLQETQLDNFRSKLLDYLPLDTTSSLDRIAEQIVERLAQNPSDVLQQQLADHQSNEAQLIRDLENLNQKLDDIYAQCEELREHNNKLQEDNARLINQLTQRPSVEERDIQTDSIGVEIETQTSIRSMQDKDTQFEPSPHTDVAIETISPTVEHRQTQIGESIRIDQQTETINPLWTVSDDDPPDFSSSFTSNGYDDADRNDEFFDEILSLSPTVLPDRLLKDCRQTLSKQTYPNPLDHDSNIALQRLALMSLHHLHTRLLNDEAKRLYDETSIRALKEEYALVHNDKNDLLEQLIRIQDQHRMEIVDYEQKFHHIESIRNDLIEQLEFERIANQRQIHLHESGNIERVNHENDLQTNIYRLENDKQRIEYEFECLKEKFDCLNARDYDRMEREYLAFKQEFDLILNENDLLKELNTQLYQEHWQDDQTKEKTFSENKSEKDDEQELIRLKIRFEEIQLENENLKDFNAQLYQEKLQHFQSENNRSLSDVEIQCELCGTDSIVQSKTIEQESQNSIRSLSMESVAVQTLIEDEFRTEFNDYSTQTDQQDEIPSNEDLLESKVQCKYRDNETQTDEQQQDKLIQINNKFKRALQTIKDKMHRIVVERPELFPDTDEDTIERLDHLIAAVEKMDTLKIERDQIEEELRHEIRDLQGSLDAYRYQIEKMTIEDYQNQIDQLQTKLSQTNDERDRLREHLNEIELELNETRNDRDRKEEKLNTLIEFSDRVSDYEIQLQNRDEIIRQQIESINVLEGNAAEYQRQMEAFLDERRSLVEQLQILSSAIEANRINQQQILDERDQAREQLTHLQEEEMKKSSSIANDDNTTTSSSELKEIDFEKETNRIAFESSKVKEKIETEPSLTNRLFGLITNVTQQTIDNQTQTDEQKQDKLSQVNTKLKRALQTIKEKVHRVVEERPELFQEVGEDTIERLDHLITAVENHATQVDKLKTERDQIEEELRHEIRDLQGSLDAYRYQIENERPVKAEQLVSAAPPSPSDIDAQTVSPSMIEEHQKQIENLQRKLSKTNDERNMLRERLNEVELELSDRTSILAMNEEQLQSLIQERDALVEQQVTSISESQREIERLIDDNNQLREQLSELQEKSKSAVDEENNNTLETLFREQSEQLRDLHEKYLALTSRVHFDIDSQTEIDTEKNGLETRLANLMDERASLLEQVKGLERDLSERDSSSITQTIDNETQTDDQKQDKLVQVNAKLKRLLQIIKEKMQRIVAERPELFPDSGEDTIERLDHLLTAVDNQATQIDALKVERDHIEAESRREIDELQSSLDTYRQQLEKLATHHVESQTLESESLATAPTIAESVVNDTPIDEHDVHLRATHRPEPRSSDSQEPSIADRLFGFLKNVSAPTTSWSEETPTNDWDDQHSPLQLPPDESVVSHSSVQPKPTVDSETQTDEPKHEKTAQVNNKLKRALQTVKDKVNRMVIERPELFPVDSSEDTIERLDHLMIAIENQGTHIDTLKDQHSHVEEELRRQISELQGSLDAYRYQIENERPVKSEALVSAAPPPSPSDVNSPTVRSSAIDDYEKQIDQLEKKLAKTNDERNMLRERLNEVELELNESLNDRTSTLAMYQQRVQSLVQERNVLVEQQIANSSDREREIERLTEERNQAQQLLIQLEAQLKSNVIQQHADETQSQLFDHRDELIREQWRELQEKYQTLSSRAEIDLQEKNDMETRYENEIENLLHERTTLREQIERFEHERDSASVTSTIDNETQTDEQQHEKLTQVNTKLKRALQTIKEKVHRVVVERPELFPDAGEDTIERLEHLITAVESQAIQIELFKAERDQGEDEFRRKIGDLQDSLDTCRSQLENERQMKTEPIPSSPENNAQSDSPSVDVEEYQKQIDQLQHNLNQNEDERNVLRERLNTIELELNQISNDRTSTVAMYEELLQSIIRERDALVEQQVMSTSDSQREIERLIDENDQVREHLLQLEEKSKSTISQHAEIQTDEEDHIASETAEALFREQSEQLRDLHEKYLALTSRVHFDIDSQTEIDEEKSGLETRLANLMDERASLLEQVKRLERDLSERDSSSITQTIDNETQTDDQKQDKLVQVNAKLKRLLQIIKEKMQRIVAERPELFPDSGEDTIERLDHLLIAVDNQATLIDTLKAERDHIEAESRREIDELQSSLDTYRQPLEKIATHDVETQTLESESLATAPTITESVANDTSIDEHDVHLRATHRPEPTSSESSNSQEPSIADRLFGFFKNVSAPTTSWSEETPTNDWDDQHSPLQLPTEESVVSRSSVQPKPTVDSETQTDEQKQEKTAQVNNKLKRALQTVKDKVNRMVIERPELFPVDSSEDTIERLDHLMMAIENQGTHIDTLKDQHSHVEEELRRQISELQGSLDAYRYQIENERPIRMEQLVSTPPPSSIVRNDVYSQTLGLSIIEEHQKHIEQLEQKVKQKNDERNMLRERLNEVELALSESVNDRSMYEEKLQSLNVLLEQHAVNVSDSRREIERLIEEREQLIRLQENMKQEYEIQLRDRDEIICQQQREQLSVNVDGNSSENLIESRLSEDQCQIDGLLRERILLLEQIKQLTSVKEHKETQTIHDSQTSSSDQRISRRVFEQEMLAWSTETEHLKQVVGRIQTENRKLKDIIPKFERMALDYMQENERLKQENQHLSWTSTHNKNEPSNQIADQDICFLTLKWLTREVALHSEMHDESSQQVLKQKLHDTERQFRSIRLQNQRLKKQLETYTLKFKHIQHEMTVKMQEMLTLKDETDRLRNSEIQYRLEVDRLKADLQCDQLKFQQLERELADMKRERSITDENSLNNLRELLELKERELQALKEKLDYASQAHQIELQEAIKSNQFSLDNVKRFEQLDMRHQAKRRELETRLAKFCRITRPLVDNPPLVVEKSTINIDELRKLIGDTEAEERIMNSLGPIRDCLGLLEAQMKELHHNLIENHARRSKQWKYKLGFECLTCESRWEVTHDIRDLQEACQDPDRFLESSLVEPMAGCSCPVMIDFLEADVRICLNDLLDEVLVKTIE